MAHHRFHTSKTIQCAVERHRYRDKWASPRGLVDENDALLRAGGLALDGTWQELSAAAAEVVECGNESVAAVPRFPATEICVAHCDTLGAALAVGDACALNFANATTPGGRYRSGGRAQEEDLCRLLPQLHPSLVASEAYPLKPNVALLSRDLLAVRRTGTYELCASQGSVSIVSAAMPCGAADRRPKGGWLGSAWAADVAARVRAVLCCAAYSGHPNLILGAFGCGAFGNPAEPVAAIFREQLLSNEFRGLFARVVFAIIDPVGTGNLRPFRNQLATIDAASVAHASEPVLEARTETA